MRKPERERKPFTKEERQLIRQINAACKDGPDAEEREFLRFALASFARLVKNDPYSQPKRTRTR